MEVEFLSPYAMLPVDPHIHELAVYARQALQGSDALARGHSLRGGNPAGILVVVDGCAIVRGWHALHLFGADARHLSTRRLQIGKELAGIR